MTIAVGLLYEDGIVLASDTMYRTGGIANYGEKIYPLSPRPGLKVLVGGAGTVGFIRAAAEKIDNALPQHVPSLIGVQAIIESANKTFYEGFVLPHGQAGQRPDYALLVAVSHHQDGNLLLCTTESAVTTVSTYELLGSGGITAEPYKSLWRRDMPDFEAELAAIFLVKYAKVYDAENCGGETRVFTFHGSYLSQLDTGYISAGEDYFTWFNQFAMSMILPADIGALDEEMFEGDIRKLVEELKHRRADLIRWHPHAYLAVP
jgi:hypothetical protein